jgi:Peptidase family M41
MPFLGREFSAEPDYSDEIAREIDDEIRRIVEGAHQQAKDILSERRESLKTISEILLKRETIEREQFEALLEGKAEEDVFGDEAPPASGAPERPRRARSRVPASPVARPRPAGSGRTSRTWPSGSGSRAAQAPHAGQAGGRPTAARARRRGACAVGAWSAARAGCGGWIRPPCRWRWADRSWGGLLSGSGTG